MTRVAAGAPLLAARMERRGAGLGLSVLDIAGAAVTVLGLLATLWSMAIERRRAIAVEPCPAHA